MHSVVISGTGVFTPTESISNDELVESFNTWVAATNAQNAAAIARGEMAALAPSNAEFIFKASGIEARHVVDKRGILDPKVMMPRLRQRTNDEPGVLAEMAKDACEKALARAQKQASDVDAVIVACSNLERAYPAVAIEVQQVLGTKGFGFDMNVACSSATFGIKTAADMIKAEGARVVLVVNPEVCTGHLNFRDRDSHFIFGDVCTALVLERSDTCTAPGAWEIVGTKLATSFSNNIRNNFGFLNRATPEGVSQPDKLFVQEGRKVFKEVVPMVASMLLEHLEELAIAPSSLSRLWLHQANKAMNDLIGRRVLGREPSADEQPNVLQTYANTSSAGSIIAFSQFSDDLPAGALGLICSFGAGYSAGNVVVKRRAVS
jgi:beta-ketodecanoyl-[acyl-carrier-protein] synthase